jgi:hypothetical protein
VYATTLVSGLAPSPPSSLDCKKYEVYSTLSMTLMLVIVTESAKESKLSPVFKPQEGPPRVPLEPPLCVTICVLVAYISAALSHVMDVTASPAGKATGKVATTDPSGLWHVRAVPAAPAEQHHTSPDSATHGRIAVGRGLKGDMAEEDCRVQM